MRWDYFIRSTLHLLSFPGSKIVFRSGLAASRPPWITTHAPKSSMVCAGSQTNFDIYYAVVGTIPTITFSMEEFSHFMELISLFIKIWSRQAHKVLRLYCSTTKGLIRSFQEIHFLKDTIGNYPVYDV